MIIEETNGERGDVRLLAKAQKLARRAEQAIVAGWPSAYGLGQPLTAPLGLLAI